MKFFLWEDAPIKEEPSVLGGILDFLDNNEKGLPLFLITLVAYICVFSFNSVMVLCFMKFLVATCMPLVIVLTFVHVARCFRLLEFRDLADVFLDIWRSLQDQLAGYLPSF